ncbi:MAG: hypothetical protein OWU32_00485 [Firmicutes bacterium]|nr:hypothetical protein [Bacillota bacterium]
MARQLVLLLWERNQHELVTLAKRSGRQAGQADVGISVISEIQTALRRTLWLFLRDYYHHVSATSEEVFVLENKINYWLDYFMGNYLASYTEYKEGVLQAQREAVDDLSVPVIPVTSTRAILPVVGIIDTHRARLIQERTLQRIAELRREELIIDLSAVVGLGETSFDPGVRAIVCS